MPRPVPAPVPLSLSLRGLFSALFLVFLLLPAVACSPGVTLEGYRIKPNENYPPARNFGGDGTRGAHPKSYDWHADNIANEKTFDWEDSFHLNEFEGTGRRPVTEDVDGDGEPDCTGTILIYSVNDSPVPTCNPYPVAAAQGSCDSMYKLAGMACRRLCEQSKVCPSPDLHVPALWEEWRCSSTVNPPQVTSMQCSGIVECTCKPET